MESKETGKTNVENVVIDGSCKDLEAQKKIEKTCQEGEQSLGCYKEHGKLENVGTYKYINPSQKANILGTTFQFNIFEFISFFLYEIFT